MRKLKKWFDGLIGTHKGLIIIGLFAAGLKCWDLTSINSIFIAPCFIFLFFAVLFTVFYCMYYRE